MPRISAPTIAEHVRQQESAILDAAARLFAEKGFADTDLADIATAVGLARPSLYRYFPDKDHILVRWFERELEPVIAHSEAIAAGDGTPDARVVEWLDYQLDYVAHPDHDVAPRVMAELGAVGGEARQAISAGHARLYGTLGSLVAQALAEREPAAARDPLVVAMLIGGMLDAAARRVIDGADTRAVRDELQRSVAAVLDA